VRYSNGEAQLTHNDLSILGGGQLFGHTRSYGYQSFGATLGPNGYNWFVNQLPYVTTLGPWTAVVLSPTLTCWFVQSGGTYSPLYSGLGVQLVENASAGTLTFTRSVSGKIDVIVFNSLSAATAPGGLVSATDANGIQLTVTNRAGSQVTELQRTYTLGGTTTTDSLLYTYVQSGSAAGLMQGLTYRRQVAGGAWTPVQQVSFAYYGASDANGSTNDLKSATQQLPDGAGGWNTVSVRYYRYWLAGAQAGFGHALKMHFSPEAYRLMFNAGINVDTASDADVLPYADQYFEYDPASWRTTKEISAVCESCAGGGSSTDLFAYASNPRYPASGYNTWQTKTTQTLPDNSKIVVYTNFAGLPMLYVNVDPTGTKMWAQFCRYNADGQIIWKAHPSAVALPASLSTLEAYDDLLNYDTSTGLYQYLNNSAGLIEVTDFYDGTTGQPKYYVQNRKVRQGQSGSDVLLRSHTYASNTDSAGNTVYPVATQVDYPVAGSTSPTITTSYAYTWYAGTNQMQQRTTTLPAIPATQNGSGVAPTIIEQFDSYGHLTQRTDERGIVDSYTYGGLQQVSEEVLNVQSGVTQPGVNVTSDFTYDLQGRLTQTLGPSHAVVLNGTATTVRKATWNVYVQSVQPSSGAWDLDQVWTGSGYATGTSPNYSYSLVDPVSIAKNDKEGRPTDRITSRRTTGSGALSPTDTFAQTDWQNWASTQYDAQHRTVSERTYYLIPSTGTGAAGTNYGETVYGYDILERRNRVMAPGGTITRTVWTCPQLVESVWVGTDDTGATDTNPATRATFIQTGTNSSRNTNVSVTLANVAAGDTLVAYAAAQSNSAPPVSAVTDNQGNTWTLIRSQAGATAAAGGAGLWVAYNVSGGATTVSFNPGVSHCALAVAEYANVSSVAPSDGSSSASTASASSTPAAGGFATTNAIDLLFAGANQSAMDVTWSAGAGYALRGSIASSTDMALAIEDEHVFSTGTYNPSFAMSASTVWTAIGAALFSSNNMVLVTANQYDGGAAGGDGNLTQVTQYASDVDTRVTQYGHDFRDRRTSMTDALNRYTAFTYDNLDRLTQTQWYASPGGTLIDQSATNYDDRNRPYQRITYAVDPSSGTVVNALTANNWYDASGNLIQAIEAGDGQVFTKNSYNGVGWVTARYRGYCPTGTSYSQAGTVANDLIVTQVLNTFDEVGNVVSAATYDRLNDAPSTGTGSTGVLSSATQPMARVSYTANWYDGGDRQIAMATYGAANSFARPNTPPASSSTVLVSNTSYDDAARVYRTTDPLGYITQTSYDNANRTTEKVEAYGTSVARTTNWTYTLDNLVATLIAVNSNTGNQTTAYTYSTTLNTSGVARNDLLVSVTFPDSTNGSDVVSYTYNRQGQQATVTDQRGTVRTFYYDKLGRQTDDCVTTVGAGTDTAVLRISTTYESRGMVQTVTSFDTATPGSGTVLNQCAMTYNALSQLTQEQQEHSGAVNGSSPSVQYGYDTGASDIRLNNITYPDTRVISYNYGAGIDAMLNRVTSISDTSATLASYTYLGASTVVRIDYPQPQVRLDLWGGVSGTFTGLDLFNRIVDQRWLNYSTSTGLDHYQYGYDQDSNRTSKANALTTGVDEFYSYDQLNRLALMQRGALNGAKTGISGTPAREMDYALDPTGNWPQYVTKTSGTMDLNQTRTSNTANEITAIGGTPTWATPGYDAAGNMTTLPQVASPTSSYTAGYDAWNRLVKLSSGGGTVATYSYDGQNRRIVKVTTATNETRHFYYTDQWQDIEERTGSPAAMERQYVWGIRCVDELICRDRIGERLYAMQDANFNPTAICDASADVQERYQYDPYGNVTYMTSSWGAIGASAKAWEVSHQGLLQDVESGLLHNRNRMVHPCIGVFSGRDSIGYASGTNLYEIEHTCPTGFIDPYGLDPNTCALVTGKRMSLAWIFSTETAGPSTIAKTGQANLNIEVRNVRAWFVRRYKDLFECCDTCDTVYWKWGSTAWEAGFKDSTGIQPKDTVIALTTGGGTMTIPTPYGPLPLGTGLPTQLWGNSKPNWPNYNQPPAPTVFGDLTQSVPQAGGSVKMVSKLTCKNSMKHSRTPGTPTFQPL
jgi:RHS repeat-associated protein